MRMTRAGTGPADYLAAHPLAYGLSLAGSGAAASYGLTLALRDSGHRVLWLALGAYCTAQFAGIVIATEVARRRAKRSGRGSLRGKLILPRHPPDRPDRAPARRHRPGRDQPALR